MPTAEHRIKESRLDDDIAAIVASTDDGAARSVGGSHSPVEPNLAAVVADLKRTLAWVPDRPNPADGTANARQGIYLSASGSLIQLNAIVAAIQGSLISLGVGSTVRLTASCALLLHVLAA